MGRYKNKSWAFLGWVEEPGSKHAICDAMRCAEWRGKSGRSTTKKRNYKNRALSATFCFYPPPRSVALGSPPSHFSFYQHNHPFYTTMRSTTRSFFFLVSFACFNKLCKRQQLELLHVRVLAWSEQEHNGIHILFFFSPFSLDVVPLSCLYQSTHKDKEKWSRGAQSTTPLCFLFSPLFSSPILLVPCWIFFYSLFLKEFVSLISMLRPSPTFFSPFLFTLPVDLWGFAPFLWYSCWCASICMPRNARAEDGAQG